MHERAIWSNEHRGWWKQGGYGYTTATHRAGQFNFEQASHIVTNANRSSGKVEEIMVEAPVARADRTRPVLS